jgi:hypothetical protein
MVKGCIHQVELSYWCIISVDGEAVHMHAHKLIGEFISVQGYLKQANIVELLSEVSYYGTCCHDSNYEEYHFPGCHLIFW